MNIYPQHSESSYYKCLKSPLSLRVGKTEKSILDPVSQAEKLIDWFLAG